MKTRPAPLAYITRLACLGALLLACATAHAAPGSDCEVIDTVHLPANETPYPRLSRALLKMDPRHSLCEDAVRTLMAYGAFVELLPLERVTVVKGSGDRIEITFDTGRCKYLYVELPDREEWMLDGKHKNLRSGRPKLRKIDGHKLRIREQLELRIRDGEIVSIREGDIQAVWGPFKRDLDLSTHNRPDRIARDEEGRILLERDEQGSPASAGGQWVPQRFDRWVHVSTESRQFWVGVTEPRRADQPLYLADAGDL